MSGTRTPDTGQAASGQWINDWQALQAQRQSAQGRGVQTLPAYVAPNLAVRTDSTSGLTGAATSGGMLSATQATPAATTGGLLGGSAAPSGNTGRAQWQDFLGMDRSQFGALPRDQQRTLMEQAKTQQRSAQTTQHEGRMLAEAKDRMASYLTNAAVYYNAGQAAPAFAGQGYMTPAYFAANGLSMPTQQQIAARAQQINAENAAREAQYAKDYQYGFTTDEYGAYRPYTDAELRASGIGPYAPTFSPFMTDAQFAVHKANALATLAGLGQTPK